LSITAAGWIWRSAIGDQKLTIGIGIGIGIGAIFLVFFFGSLRATIVWHKRHPAVVRCGHVALAAVGTPATFLMIGVAAWFMPMAPLHPSLIINGGILAAVIAAALLTWKFPTTAAAASS